MTTQTTAPFVADDLDSLIEAALAKGETTVRANVLRSCPFCDASRCLQQYATIATGLPIDQSYPDPVGTFVYEPRRGEILKNHYMVCVRCGADQGS